MAGFVNADSNLRRGKQLRMDALAGEWKGIARSLLQITRSDEWNCCRSGKQREWRSKNVAPLGSKIFYCIFHSMRISVLSFHMKPIILFPVFRKHSMRTIRCASRFVWTMGISGCLQTLTGITATAQPAEGTSAPSNIAQGGYATGH